MSDNLAQDAMRLNEAAKNLEDVIIAVIKGSGGIDVVEMAVNDVLASTPVGNDFRGRIMFANKMIREYVHWLQTLRQSLEETATRIQQAGTSGGPFG